MSPGRLRDPSRRPLTPPPPRRTAAGASPPADTGSLAASNPPADADTPASSDPAADGKTPAVTDTPADADTPAEADPAADARPLAGRAVLVPRSEGRATRLAALLRERGARVLVAPAITHAPVDDRGPLEDAVRRLAAGAFGWVAVTSVNAVDALTASAHLTTHPGPSTVPDRNPVPDPIPDPNPIPDPTRLRGGAGPAVRWAAVGPATRRALEAAGLHVDLEPEEHSARGLVAAFAALPSPESPHELSARVLLPQGDLAGPTLADGLRRLGYEAEVVTAYRTVGHDLPEDLRRAWHAGGVDAVVLTSGSVAREIARQLGPRDDVAGIAIGEPTAEAARIVGLRLDAVADAATDDALAEAVALALAGGTARVAAAVQNGECADAATATGDTPTRDTETGRRSNRRPDQDPWPDQYPQPDQGGTPA